MDKAEEHCANLRNPWNGCEAHQPEATIETLQAQLAARDAEIGRLQALINTPLTDDFVTAVNMEALHQRERWGAAHDAGKQPADWFWLIGYLAQKAMTAHIAENRVKAAHHTISTAAAMANWHLAITGADTSMRPGINAPALGQGEG